MSVDALRQRISEFLGFSIPETPASFRKHHVVQEHGYDRISISYTSPEGDHIPAFLLLPQGTGPFPAMLIRPASRWPK